MCRTPGWSRTDAEFVVARFIGRRLLYLLPVLLTVTLLTFLIASLLPGDLAVTILRDQATPEQVAALLARSGSVTCCGCGTSCKATSAARSAPARPCWPPCRIDCRSRSS